MRIHILGLGSIGCLLAHHLRQSLPSRHTIAVIHKDAKRAIGARLAGNRINLETGGATVFSEGFFHEVYTPAGQAPLKRRRRRLSPEITPLRDAGEPIESLILCVKAIGTVATLQDLLPRLSPSSTIVLMQNGMGIYEHLVERVFRNPKERPHFVLASINHGVHTKSYMHIVHRGYGDITFGIVPDGNGRDFEASLPDLNLNDITPNTPGDPHAARYLSLRNTVAALSSLQSLNARWKPIYDVHMAMRRKVVVNSVINPLTALMDCRNGDVFSTEAGTRLCHLVCKEASAVFLAQWKAELQAAREAEQSVDQAQFPSELTTESLEQFCHQVSANTADNFSSMLVDVKHGRRTEIECMNGYLLNLGKQHKVAMPANSVLTNLIRLRNALPLR